MDVDQNANTITLPAIADTMRSLPDTLGIGAGPFSPKGADYYFVKQIMKKWPKVVSVMTENGSISNIQDITTSISMHCKGWG